MKVEIKDSLLREVLCRSRLTKSQNLAIHQWSNL